MKKLQVGDYVKNLTEKQFDKLMETEAAPEPYIYVKGQTDTLVFGGEYLGFNEWTAILKTQLTYRQFLLRAKMTFNVAPMTQK